MQQVSEKTSSSYQLLLQGTQRLRVIAALPQQLRHQEQRLRSAVLHDELTWSNTLCLRDFCSLLLLRVAAATAFPSAAVVHGGRWMVDAAAVWAWWGKKAARRHLKLPAGIDLEGLGRI